MIFRGMVISILAANTALAATPARPRDLRFGPGTPASGGYFPASSPWHQDVSAAPLDSESAAIIQTLANDGGWGNGNAFQIDFSFEVLQGDASTPFRTFTRTGDFYSPDCDFVPMPVPAVGALEGEDGYACQNDGDCHLIVVHQPTHMLYEMWRADIRGAAFNGGCLAVWDMSKDYGNLGRGEGCTSADAAGFPIAPLLFSADEVAAGEIRHAVRFILPNERIRHLVYVHPGTHSTGPTSGGPTAIPYGARLRLRADYPLGNLPNAGARVVARALQKYGMMLADGGQIALTAQNDTFTTQKWNGLLGPQDLRLLHVSDFEVVDSGPKIDSPDDCTRRNP
jgi:serine/threonine-protein kinase